MYVQSSLPAEYFIVQLDCCEATNDIVDSVVICATAGRTLQYVTPLKTIILLSVQCTA